ncbi:tetratricopeptide repeat protein [Candidatus Methylobacter oryzae]|uniref:protein O-GlcNAc transferase n=1 Tax=Candidatus Methylobacter oryzae TaxID=2497749 RepID=A0ABY3CBU2_9GAMM|nr:tetratricopeptide repeat protein [Candidatus Methylobacter oryzae]TRW97084.1 tetratricopeptide repeat protein [Candidatus Methylobacter oryzae]
MKHKTTFSPTDYLRQLNQALNNNEPETVLKLASNLAVKDALPIAELFSATQQLRESGHADQAIDLYRSWLKHTTSPIAYAVQFNLAVCLSDAKDDAAAEEAYRRALRLNPNFIEAYLNLGTLLERHGQFDEAIDLWRTALSVAKRNAGTNPALHIQVLNNLGRLLELLKNLQEAEQMLAQSLKLNPKQPKVLTHFVHLRQKQCEWPIYCEIEGVTLNDMLQATSALAMLSASNDPARQLAASRNYVQENVNIYPAPLANMSGYAHKRLRIGYLSSDFHAHAVAILTAELFELHDRENVEVYGFCWSSEDGSPIRARIIKAMDHFIGIAEISDEQAAQCIRSHEIDILVDLHGLTQGTRPNILSWRPAPVQITYLGFPGPTALPCIDYVLADKFVLPPELTPYFTERPLYMPRSFQINDRQREVGPRPTRADCGLPDDAFVFCSFNNNFKITEEVFTAWMRILSRVPGSVLWLVSDHQSVRSSLAAHAQRLGVDPERLLFAERVSPAAYLARYQAADLFLDTMPFNAGTTASDALWAGLPLLTCAGNTFSSRMAGSLLMAVDLPELITYSLQEYEDKAVSLTEQPEKIAAMKQQLQENRLSCSLFDSPQFVRDLENIFKEIAVQTPQNIKQTPINNIHNVDVLNFMRADFTGIVEVGSSSGALARAYRDINPACSYIGIEIDQDYAEASKQHCTEVIYGNVEHLPDETFKKLGDAQCWVFADALEHLYDPWQLLRRIKRNARSGVEVIACIPNAQYWGVQSALNSGRFIYQDSGLLDRTHIRWLTRITILDLFHANGFQVVEMISRILQQPSEEMIAGIRQIASASGSDPDLAVQDAIAFQYVVRAVAVD